LEKKPFPKITIGLPVYNGEKIIRQRIESILSQTFNNFELIISDNHSSDKTAQICKEFLKRDNRIKYFRQDKNIGILQNFLFVLEKADKEYFVWAAVDDIWEPSFLEFNSCFLDSHKEFVGSIGRVDYFVEKSNKKIKFMQNQNSHFVCDFDNDKARKLYLKKYENYPTADSSYEKFVEFFLRLHRSELVYSLFRTSKLKKAIISKKMMAMDMAIILGVLKYGLINIGNEENFLIHRYKMGISAENKGLKKFRMFNDYGLIGLIFPFLPFTFWCFKNLGLKIFFKNFKVLLRFNIGGAKRLLASIKNPDF